MASLAHSLLLLLSLRDFSLGGSWKEAQLLSFSLCLSPPLPLLLLPS